MYEGRLLPYSKVLFDEQGLYNVAMYFKTKGYCGQNVVCITAVGDSGGQWKFTAIETDIVTVDAHVETGAF